MFSTSRPLLTGQSVRRWWFGGVGGVLFPPRQLLLQIGNVPFGVGDLFFGVSDLFFAFGYHTPKVFVFSQ